MARTLHNPPPHGRFPRAQAGEGVRSWHVRRWRREGRTARPRDLPPLPLDRLPRGAPMTLQPTPAGGGAATGTASATAATTVTAALAGALPDRAAAGRLFLAAERLPASLSPAELRSCEDGFVQRALWPLFHDLAPLAAFDLADW